MSRELLRRLAEAEAARDAALARLAEAEQREHQLKVALWIFGPAHEGFDWQVCAESHDWFGLRAEPGSKHWQFGMQE